MQNMQDLECRKTDYKVVPASVHRILLRMLWTAHRGAMKPAPAILLCTFLTAQAHADQWVNLVMEGTSTINCAPGVVDSELITQHNLPRVLGLEGNVQCPWITTSNKFAGSKALALWLKPDAETKTRSQVEAIGPLDTFALHAGTTRYLGFAIYLGYTNSDWPLAPNGVVFMQAWQAHAPCGVPLTGILLPNIDASDLRYQFYVSYDTYGGLGHTGGAIFHESKVLWENRPLPQMLPGRWHLFVMKLKPKTLTTAGTGNVTIWHNDMSNPDNNWLNSPIATYDGDWGCIPEPGKGDDWRVDVGAYRPQKTNPDQFSEQNLVVILDNIRVASTKAEAIP